LRRSGVIAVIMRIRQEAIAFVHGHTLKWWLNESVRHYNNMNEGTNVSFLSFCLSPVKSREDGVGRLTIDLCCVDYAIDEGKGSKWRK